MLKKLFFNWMYVSSPPWDTGVTPPEVLRFIQSHPAGRAVDLGCGTGTNVITLAQHGWDVIGVDFAKQAIRVARKKMKHAQVKAQVIQGDVTRLDILQPAFDLILDIGCFHGLTPTGKLACLEGMQRIIKPGGTLLMYAFLKNEEDRTPGLTQPDLDRLKGMFHLVNQENGSERDFQASTWLTFEL